MRSRSLLLDHDSLQTAIQLVCTVATAPAATREVTPNIDQTALCLPLPLLCRFHFLLSLATVAAVLLPRLPPASQHVLLSCLCCCSADVPCPVRHPARGLCLCALCYVTFRWQHHDRSNAGMYCGMQVQVQRAAHLQSCYVA